MFTSSTPPSPILPTLTWVSAPPGLGSTDAFHHHISHPSHQWTPSGGSLHPHASEHREESTNATPTSLLSPPPPPLTWESLPPSSLACRSTARRSAWSWSNLRYLPSPAHILILASPKLLLLGADLDTSVEKNRHWYTVHVGVMHYNQLFLLNRYQVFTNGGNGFKWYWIINCNTHIQCRVRQIQVWYTKVQ